MDLDLAGKIAIVTGASRGLGRAIALALAQEGMDLVLVARDQGLLAGLAREIGAIGRRSLICVADLRDEKAAAKTVDTALEKFGRLDLLVNNAGAAKRGDFLTLTDADWADGFALKFFGYVRMSRASWPHLQKTYRGPSRTHRCGRFRHPRHRQCGARAVDQGACRPRHRGRRAC